MVVRRIFRLLITPAAFVVGAALLADVIVGNPLSSFALMVGGAKDTGQITASEYDVYEPDWGPSQQFYHVTYQFTTPDGRKFSGNTKYPTHPLKGVDTERGPLPTIDVEYERSNPENNRDYGMGPSNLWQLLLMASIFIFLVGAGFRAARDHIKERIQVACHP